MAELGGLAGPPIRKGPGRTWLLPPQFARQPPPAILHLVVLFHMVAFKDVAACSAGREGPKRRRTSLASWLAQSQHLSFVLEKELSHTV